nr:hypothetical protein [Tanacetum cinerariifolium]
ESESDSDVKIRLSGSLVESLKQKPLKKFVYINEKGKTIQITQEEIENQKGIDKTVKADAAKSEIKKVKQDLIDLGGLGVVERMYRDKVKTCFGWTTIYTQMRKRLDAFHKTKEELEMDFNKPLDKQDHILKLNLLAKNKRKNVDDLHDYFRSTKRYKKLVQFANH